MLYRVRLEGFNFTARVPESAQDLPRDPGGLVVSPVPAAWAKPSASGAPAAATWCLVEAKNEQAAEVEFRDLHGIRKVSKTARFHVEPASSPLPETLERKK